VTSHFPELLPVLGTLPAGTVLDGEVVAFRGGVFDFHALAKPPRARAAAGVAVSYAAFDVLHDGELGVDMRNRPLWERWERLLALLNGAPPQVAPVLTTEDRGEAERWMTALAPLGVEGIVAKSLDAPYRPSVGHGWQKYRHSDTVDADLVGLVGPADRPTALRVRLEDGRGVVTVNLEQRRLRQAMDGRCRRGGRDRAGRGARLRRRRPA
jgi:ATP-dependent DNA ligase